MAFQSQNYVQDLSLRLKDAGLVAASANGTVGGSAAYVDFGAANAYAEFDVVVDWTACEVASGDEIYTLIVQGATDSAFTSAFDLGRRVLGDTAVTGHPVDTTASGRTVIHCDNTAITSASDPNSISAFRYVRIRCIVAGTIATGFNYTAFVSPKK